MCDRTVADVGRRLAVALARFARERGENDRKAIALAQTELCAAVRAEQDEIEPAKEAAP